MHFWPTLRSLLHNVGLDFCVRLGDSSIQFASIVSTKLFSVSFFNLWWDDGFLSGTVLFIAMFFQVSHW